MGAPDLIPPDVRARLRGLHLFARGNAGGDGLGQHASRSRGAGLEFAQYRAYACVIELALRQGDRFGLIALGGSTPVLVPVGVGARQRDRCLLELARITAAGSWPEALSLRPLRERIARDALVIFLSDFFDDAAVELAEHLALARREVLTVQILGSDERDFPFSGGHRFRDPESTIERRVDAGAVRKDFLERFAAARSELARRFAGRGIRHTEHVLDERPDAPLQRFFGQRNARA